MWDTYDERYSMVNFRSGGLDRFVYLVIREEGINPVVMGTYREHTFGFLGQFGT